MTISSFASELKIIQPRFHLSTALFSSSEIEEMSGMGRSGELLELRLMETTDRLLKELASRGYPLASVDSVQVNDSASVRIVDLFIGLGKPIIAIESERRKILNIGLLEQRATHLLDSLTDAGFPFARISFRPDHLEYESGGLAAELQTIVKPGPFCRIGRIRFPGASPAVQKTLQKESRLKPAAMFRHSDLTKAKARIERFPRVVHADEPSLTAAAPGYIDIDLPVITRSGTRATGIASLSPGSNKPTGEVEIQIGELFGGSRSVEFGWYGLDPARLGIKGSYREDRIAGLPISLVLEIVGWQVTGLHGRTTYRVRGVWEPFEDLIIGLGGAAERVAFQADSLSGLGSRTNWIETSPALRRFDDDWNPSQGYNFSIESRQGFRRQLNSTKSTSEIQWNGTKLEIATPIRFRSASGSAFGKAEEKSSELISYFRAEYNQLTGNQLFIDELPRLGGATTVRGYEEGQFFGRGIFAGSAELRYRPDREAGYAGVFFDWGWIAQVEPAVSYEKRNLASIGLTTAFQTGAGRLGLDLGWPPGEPFEQSRLHFRITSWL